MPCLTNIDRTTNTETPKLEKQFSGFIEHTIPILYEKLFDVFDYYI